MIRTMKERADINAREATDFRDFMERTTSKIKEGFEAISDLDGLVVSAEVRGRINGTVSATVGGDTGGGSSDGTYGMPTIPGGYRSTSYNTAGREPQQMNGRNETHHHYNLTIQTQATTENVVDSYATMQALAGMN